MTDICLRSLKEGTYWDRDLKAFGIRVGKAVKTFFIVRNGGTRTTIGRFPSKTLQAARLEAKRLLIQPAIPTSGLSFHEAYSTYLNTYIKPKYRPQPAREFERLMEKHCAPLFQKPIAQISHLHVEPILASTTQSQAIYLFGILRTFFLWAERRDFCASPMRKLDRPATYVSRERTLSDAELRAVVSTALASQDVFAAIVLLLAYTGQRKGELSGMTPEMVKGDIIEFPAWLTKNKTTHVLPIGPKVQTLLAKHSFQQFSGWSKRKARLDKACGVYDWTLHDLRRTWSTKAAEWGICPPHVTERILNHKTSSHMTAVARIYDRHDYLPQMRAAMCNYEKALTRIVSLEATTEVT